MSEYIYASNGEPLANERREISLARKRVTRCRDCAWSDDAHGSTICTESEFWRTTDPDGYCHRAKPREN